MEMKVKAGNAPVHDHPVRGARKLDPIVAAHVKEQWLKGV